jgi:hypothetical protein
VTAVSYIYHKSNIFFSALFVGVYSIPGSADEGRKRISREGRGRRRPFCAFCYVPFIYREEVKI